MNNFLLKNELITTRTIISQVNLEFDIEKVFRDIPLYYNISGYENCAIVTMYHKENIKGQTDIFEKKKNKSSFRNAVNIIIKVNTKFINLKLSKRGNFQITGCKNMEECFFSVQYLIELLLLTCKDCIVSIPKDVTIYFYTVMTNLVFNTGYEIDRKKLSDIINQDKNFYNLFETNFGYTGMNVKLPLEDKMLPSTIPFYQFNVEKKEWKIDTCPFNKPSQKKKFNTFLIFHSGKIIMSGMCETAMEKHYSFFRHFLEQHANEIKEVIL